MQVFPIAVTQGDLTTLIRVCENVLGYSPTRALDQCHLDSKDPAAFLAVLPLDNAPLETLRHGRQRSNILSHFSVSFLAVTDNTVLVDVQTLTKLKVHTRVGRKEHVSVLTGTLDEWYDSIVATCRENIDKDTRGLFNAIVAHLERVGFREVLSTLHKQKLRDGTFIIKTGRL